MSEVRTDFDTWFHEQEGASLRSERFNGDVEWLKAAFDAGRSAQPSISTGQGEAVMWVPARVLEAVQYRGTTAIAASNSQNEVTDTPLYAHPSLPAGRVAVPVEPTHRHKKRGTEYVLIGYGKMQAENWEDTSRAFDESGYIGGDDVDMREVAIYRSIDGGSLWARPREEFEDGRFEALPHNQGEGSEPTRRHCCRLPERTIVLRLVERPATLN